MILNEGYMSPIYRDVEAFGEGQADLFKEGN